ncbi:MAG: hypothetical protein ACO4AI_12565, partial [Prochlorothrix sp.]
PPNPINRNALLQAGLNVPEEISSVKRSVPLQEITASDTDRLGYGPLTIDAMEDAHQARD